MFRTVLVLAFGLAVTQGVAFAADYGLPPQSSPVVAANSFLGGYAALGGSYGINAQRSASMSASGPNFASSSSGSISGSPEGWSGVAAIGYNMAFGPALIGVELDGRWGDEKFSRDLTSANFSGTSAIPNGGQVAYRFSSNSDAAVHLATRVGALLGNTLIFGKLGVGASRIRDSFGTDQSGALACASVNTTTSPFTCLAPVSGGAATHILTRWFPTIILGVGAEQNFGPLFARVAAEAETFAQNSYSFTQPTANGWTFSGSSSTANTQWAARAMLMAGIRF